MKPKLLILLIGTVAALFVLAGFFIREGQSTSAGSTSDRTVTVAEIIEMTSDRSRNHEELSVELETNFYGRILKGRGRVFHRTLSTQHKSAILLRPENSKGTFYFRASFAPTDNDILRNLDKNQLYDFQGVITRWSPPYSLELASVELKPVGPKPDPAWVSPTLAEIEATITEKQSSGSLSPEDLTWFKRIDYLEEELLDELYGTRLVGAKVEGVGRLGQIKPDRMAEGKIPVFSLQKVGSILINLNVPPENRANFDSLKSRQQVRFSGVISSKRLGVAIHLEQAKVEPF